jgi:Phospholipase_D-nuclease N-terminal
VGLVPYLLVLALWVYAFIDCVTTPEEEILHLPKVAWVLIVLLLGEVMVGPIAWLVLGKDRGRTGADSGGTPSEWHREHRHTPPIAPDDDPDFLLSLRDQNKQDESMLKRWEADLRRREEELRRREGGTEGPPENG